ncbi:uncharacterized protein LOC105693983 [Athalia rosae]|uniref:uncharacterized protein LOC105693983 n=1 Tax=Athalia rosae TaxID=37344 RepID=UPI00203331D1|nr:uncharacterized protein LOC105693983 [Athalia rosae]
MEIEDDDTYAVIVSESGETQIYKLGPIDLCNTEGVVVLSGNADASAGVISEQCDNATVEEPDLKNWTTRSHPTSRHRKMKTGGDRILDDPETEGVRISRENVPDSFTKVLKKHRKIAANNLQLDDSYLDTRIHPPGRLSWSRSMTRALVDEYRNLMIDFGNPSKRQRDVWESMASKLRKNYGYTGITWDMCDRKWRNLKSTFKTIYHSKRPLYSKKRWEFYEEFKILFAPDVRGTEEDRKSAAILPPSSSESNRRKNDQEAVVRKWSSDQPMWFGDFLHIYRTGHKARMDIACEQHKKRMEIKRRICELLDRIIHRI